MLYWLNCQSKPRLRMRTKDEELRFWKFKELPRFWNWQTWPESKARLPLLKLSTTSLCACSNVQHRSTLLLLSSEHPNLKTRTSMMFTVKDNVSGHEIRAKTECLEKLKMCESNLHKSCQDSLPMFIRKNSFSSLII